MLQSILHMKGDRAGAMDVAMELLAMLERGHGASGANAAAVHYNVACLQALEGPARRSTGVAVPGRGQGRG